MGRLHDQIVEKNRKDDHPDKEKNSRYVKAFLSTRVLPKAMKVTQPNKADNCCMLSLQYPKVPPLSSAYPVSLQQNHEIFKVQFHHNYDWHYNQAQKNT